MKNCIRTISVILALLCFSAPLFTSCSNDKDTEVELLVDEFIRENAGADFTYTHSDDKQYIYNVRGANGGIDLSDGYIYYGVSLREADGSSVNTILKVNPETGVTSFCCKNPLCLHKNEECPLYGRAGGFHVYDGKILFNRMFYRRIRDANGRKIGTERVFDEVCYDSNTDTLTVIDKHEGDSLTQNLTVLFADDCCYYYDYKALDENSEEYKEFYEKNRYSPTFVYLTKLDMNTYEKTVVCDKPDLMYSVVKFCFVLNDRIYYTDGKRLYSRDVNNKNEIEHCVGAMGNTIYTDGESAYYAMDSEDSGSRAVYDVYRIRDMNDYSSKEKIIESCSSWFLTENYIYYTDTSGRTAGGINFGGKGIRRCDHSGENDELVFKYEGDYEMWQLTESVICGNYIYADYYYYSDDNGDGVIDREKEYHNSWDSIARIDVNTGEVYIIENKLR